MPTHRKLVLAERRLLGWWKGQGLSNKECARRLDRHCSTIGRELKRNQYFSEQGSAMQNGVSFYEFLHAQAKAEARKQLAWQHKHPLKNKQVYQYVLEHLRDGWSPEQIAGRLRQEHPSDPSWWICQETIYRFCYHPSWKEQRWWEYLRRGQKKRRKRLGRKTHRCRIPERISIHERPEIVNQRIQFGHWEGDTLVGKERRNGLHTAYERISSLTRLARMNRLTAEESLRAQEIIYQPLPSFARRSTTLDNAQEHVLHRRLKEKLGTKTYFADPYSSWQRGGNENANLWIRYYFPKGTDFSKIPAEEIEAVEWELNNRPRKRLHFQTPLEVFSKHLRGCDRS